MIEEKEELQGQLIASGQVVASMVSQKGEKGDPGEPGSPGVPGEDGFSPLITTSKENKTTTVTIVDAEGTKTATILDGSDGQNGQDGNDGVSPTASVSKVGKIATITITDAQGTTTAEIRDGEDGSGSGDMLKSTYDIDNNGIVDNAEKVNNHTVESNVPANAVFTDTTYTAGTNVSISAQNVISATDTTYTAGAGIDITNGIISNTQTSAEWGNISGDIDDQTDLQNILSDKVDSSDLSTVATSGSYNDLSDKPTIMSGLTELSYGNSTWNDFITAYNNNQIVYCKASSGVDPSVGDQMRKAFMAYVRIENDEITYVEFQYIRSITTHTSSQQGDQVFVYTLTNVNGGTWSVTTREMSTKVVAGTNMTSSYSSGVLTLNAEAESIPVQDTAPQNPEEDDLWIDTSDESGGTNILDVIFPVGSIVIKADNEDYSSWLGFTWERTLVGRVAVGIDSTQTEFDTIGETGGEKKHTLTVNEMPSHKHDRVRLVEGNQYLGRAGGSNSNVAGLTLNNGQYPYDNTTYNNADTSYTGGGQAHNILQPYQVVAYWKRTA